ncbi:unnamed protein product [Arabidopsis thaliana]|uniref:non-specific serine/threonine protein kinase n=1 Tax=Arabidopsis thaliana TaxID=3702 RepID=A0A7G2EH63_ARATH|nr:unnamed protein product [Arabidopsis thaliana]
MNGFTTLTNTKKHAYGQAFNDEPFPFKNSVNGNMTSFSFTFFFAIVPEHIDKGSHGIAFVISPTRGIPGASADQYLGIFNDTNDGNSSNHIIAVELDIHKDDEFGDIDDNHVGININGMRSIVSAPAGYYDQNGQFKNLSLISGNLLRVTILYSQEEKQLNVTLSPAEEANVPKWPLLSLNKDLSPYLSKNMYIGFTASTGSVGAIHYMWMWYSKVIDPVTTEESIAGNESQATGEVSEGGSNGSTSDIYGDGGDNARIFNRRLLEGSTGIINGFLTWTNTKKPVDAESCVEVEAITLSSDFGLGTALTCAVTIRRLDKQADMMPDSQGSAGFFKGYRTLTSTKKHAYGQAFEDEIVPFKNSANDTVTSFSVTFFFAIAPEDKHKGAHGMAFVISPTRGITGASADQYLGIFNKANNGDSSNHVIAVELDINKDEEFGDINDNHVGININGMRSIKFAPAGYYDQEGQFKDLSLISGSLLRVTILYSQMEKQLNVTLSSPEEAYYPNKPLLSLNQDLSPYILENMYVGFSASTGSVRAMHYMLSWSQEGHLTITEAMTSVGR